MATRIESKSRTAKKTMGTLTWNGSAFTATGRVPRLDMRGFPTNNGADSTAVTYVDAS